MADFDIKFYTRAVSLDVLKTQEQPNTEAADFLAELLENEEYSQYFFKDLSNPAWLQPLNDRGVFTRPPQTGRWTAIGYLERIAGDFPEDVVQIITSIPPTNSVVLWDSVGVLLRLRPEHASQAIPAVDDWLGCENLKFTNFSSEIGKLFPHLVAANQFDAAIQLLDFASKHKIDEQETGTKVTSRTEPYWFAQMLRKQVKSLVQARPLRCTIVLTKNLREAIEIQYGGEPYNGNTVYVRASIADESDSHQNEYIHAMISCLRDSLQKALDQADTPEKETGVVQIVDEYLMDSPSLFERIALYIITVRPEVFDSQVKHVISDSGFVGRSSVKPEYMYFLSEVYGLLAEDQCGLLWQQVDKYAATYKDDDPTNQIKGRNYIRFEFLYAARDSLDDEKKAVYDSLVREFDEPKDLFNPQIVTFWSGVTSPLSPLQMGEMNPTAVIEYLKIYEQTEPEIGPGVPTVIGLADAFEKDVEARHRDYAAVARKLITSEVNPTYINRFFQALHSACRNGDSLNWPAVLELCKITLTYQWPRIHEEDYQNPLYSFRMSVARLLDEGVKKSEDGIPIDRKSEVLAILGHILAHPSPSEVGDLEFDGTNMGAFEISLNRPQGSGMHALISTALWISRNEYGKDAAVRLDPDVKCLLEENLDRKRVPSLAVHSVYGSSFINLYSLHKEWAIQMLPQVFPRAEKDEPYWKVAFGAYLRWDGRFFDETYRLLREEYERAIRVYEKGGIAGEELAKHIVISFTRGVENLDVKDSLVTEFFATTPDHIRADAMSDIWRAGGKEKLFENPELWAKYKKLWQARVDFKKVNHEQEMGKEFECIMHWCDHIPENPKELYSLLDFSIEHSAFEWDVGHISGYLLKYSVEFPEEVIALLFKLQTCAGVHRVAFMHERETVREILRAVINSGCDPQKQIAYDIVSRFGEWDDHSYQDLI